jgi:hypothetical protein
VAIHRIDDAAALSRYYWHVDGEVFVRYRHWHVCSSPDDTFSDCLLAVETTSLYRGRLYTYTVCPWVGR